MKTKIISGILLAILTSLTLVSAIAFSVSINTLTFTPDISSKTFTVTNQGQPSLLDISFSSLSINNENGNPVSFTVTGNTTINTSSTFTITPTTPIDFSKFNLDKEYSGDLVISETGTPTNNKTIKVFIQKTFCKAGVHKEATIDSKVYKLDGKVKIENKGYGDNDNEWYPLDDVEIEVTAENNGDEDVDDVNIEACLYNPDENECVLDEDDINLEDNDFNLKDGDEKDVLGAFQLEPDEIDENVDNYILYTKVYSDDAGEDKLCVEFSDDITIIRDKHFAVLENIEIPETAKCDEEIEIRADVWNIGEDDEQDVSANVYNKELGIDEKIEIGDIDALDKEELVKTIKIPENAQEKKYDLRLTVYDEDGDTFENENDDKSIFVGTFKVEGCAAKQAVKNAEISALLETADEDVKPGKEIVIKATIKNTGQETTTYLIGVDGNEQFSTEKSITPKSLTLEPGKSQETSIILKLNDDAEGEKIFNIKATFDSKEIKQPVSLVIAKSAGVSITGSAIMESFRSNWFIWVIVLVNVILIIVIIIVALRMSRA